MPTVSEYNVFKEASAEVQENMTFYYIIIPENLVSKL